MMRLPPIMQVAFMVEDIHAAVRRWAEDMGVGPFFVQEHVQYRSLTYRGAPCAADVSLAFAFTGDLQIELVCQHNDAPSVFRDAIEAYGFGAQHLGRVCEDVGEELARLARSGIEPLQRGVSPRGTETVFLPFQVGPSCIIELIQSSDLLIEMFAFQKEAAANWDGSTAVYSG